MAEQLSVVKAAIAAMATPSETQRANEWLVDFERSSAAWQVCDLLLREPDASHQFFGAKFLYSKIQRQFLQLDAAMVASLSQNLVQHIITTSQQPVPTMNVIRYLCLALAALTLQLNQEGIVSNILVWLHPVLGKSPGVLLELLTVLPEESDNHLIDVPWETKQLYVVQLKNTCGEVLTFLSGLWGTVGPPVKSQILRCLERWVEVTRVTMPVLTGQAVYGHMLESLMAQDETFEHAVDAAIAVLRNFQSEEPLILESLCPLVVALRTRWVANAHTINKDLASGTSVSELDDDILSECRSLCRLFTETCEACFDVITTHVQSYNLHEVVANLVECTKFCDHSIARIPLNYFYDMGIVLHRMKDEKPGEAEVETFLFGSSKSAALKTFFVPIFINLLGTAINQITLSEAEIASLSVSGITDDKREMRVEWCETVQDCSYAVGAETCLQLLCTELTGAFSAGYTTTAWRKAESCMTCIQMIANNTKKSENTLVPQLLQFAASISQQPTIPAQARNAIIAMIGRFAFWLETHEDYLPMLLNYLYSTLAIPSSVLSASLAITNTLRYCKYVPRLPIQELHTLILSMRQLLPPSNSSSDVPAQNALPVESDLLLLEGITVVISNLPEEARTLALQSILSPIAKNLDDMLSTGTAPNNAALSMAVDRIAVVFKHVTGDGEICCNAFVSVLPALVRTIETSTSEVVYEKVCRCYKYAVRGSRLKFLPYLPNMIEHITIQFQRAPVAAYLYVAAVCVGEYHDTNDGAYVQELYKMLFQLSTIFFSKFPTIEAYEHNPDVVEEYFFLMAKVMQHCPRSFVEEAAFSTPVLQAAMIGLPLKHRGALKGVLSFFENFVRVATFWPAESPTAGTARALVNSVGQTLCVSMFSLVTSKGASAAIDDQNGSIGDVLWSLRKRFNDQFKVWLTVVYEGMPEAAQNIALKMCTFKELIDVRGADDFLTTLIRFENAYRNNT